MGTNCRLQFHMGIIKYLSSTPVKPETYLQQQMGAEQNISMEVESLSRSGRNFQTYRESLCNLCVCVSDLYSLSVSSPFAVRYPCVCLAATASACDAELLRRRWRPLAATAGATSASCTPSVGSTSAEDASAAAAAALDAAEESNPAFELRLLRVALAASALLRLLLRRFGLEAGLEARRDEEEEDDAALLSLFLTLRGRERERVRATIAASREQRGTVARWHARDHRDAAAKQARAQQSDKRGNTVHSLDQSAGGRRMHRSRRDEEGRSKFSVQPR